MKKMVLVFFTLFYTTQGLANSEELESLLKELEGELTRFDKNSKEEKKYQETINLNNITIAPARAKKDSLKNIEKNIELLEKRINGFSEEINKLLFSVHSESLQKPLKIELQNISGKLSKLRNLKIYLDSFLVFEIDEFNDLSKKSLIVFEKMLPAGNYDIKISGIKIVENNSGRKFKSFEINKIVELKKQEKSLATKILVENIKNSIEVKIE